MDVLLDTLKGATGLFGRRRNMISQAERARQSVAKAIRDASKRVAQHDPSLEIHLRRTVRTGLFCVYDPDPEARPDWRL
jgi:non-specific serine/threonine protein kinase